MPVRSCISFARLGVAVTVKEVKVKGRTSFLKKRSKKLLLIASGRRFNLANPVRPVTARFRAENIRKFSETEMRARRAKGESQTDLARVRAKTEADLSRDIAADPDWKDVPQDWYERAELVMPTSKKLLSLRRDEDIIDWFKQQGPGYQTKMNAVLRACVHQAEKRRALHRPAEGDA